MIRTDRFGSTATVSERRSEPRRNAVDLPVEKRVEKAVINSTRLVFQNLSQVRKSYRLSTNPSRQSFCRLLEVPPTTHTHKPFITPLKPQSDHYQTDPYTTPVQPHLYNPHTHPHDHQHRPTTASISNQSRNGRERADAVRVDRFTRWSELQGIRANGDFHGTCWKHPHRCTKRKPSRTSKRPNVDRAQRILELAEIRGNQIGRDPILSRFSENRSRNHQKLPGEGTRYLAYSIPQKGEPSADDQSGE